MFKLTCCLFLVGVDYFFFERQTFVLDARSDDVNAHRIRTKISVVQKHIRIVGRIGAG